MADDAARATPRLALAIAAAFALAVGLGLAHHELWLDEAQAWLIAGRAGSLLDVLVGLRYEGHPPLWYALLFGASRVVASPVVMQVLAGLAATAAVFLFAWRSPFSPLQKALFAFGYFPLFEYGVTSRGYGLGLACLAAYAALRFAGDRRAWLLAVPLALAALTSAYGLVLAWALAIGLAVAILDPADADRAPGRSRGDRLAAAGVLGAATAIALATMQVPADASFRVALAPGVDVLRAAWATYAPFWAFVPLPDPGAAAPWNTGAFAGKPVWGQLAYVLGAATLGLAALALAARPAGLAAFVAGAGVLWAFCYVGYAGSLRHHGHYFLLWILALWTAAPAGPRARALGARIVGALAPLATPGAALGTAIGVFAMAALAGANPLAPWSAALLALVVLEGVAIAAARAGVPQAAWARLGPGGLGLTALLALHVGVGAWLLRADLARPFTGTAPLAAAIQAGDPGGGLPVYVLDVADKNYLGPPLALALGREVVYVEEARHRPGTYLVWDRHRPTPVDRGGDAAAERLVRSQRALWRLAHVAPAGEVAFLAAEVVVPEFPPGLVAEVVAAAGVPVASDEPGPLVLYRVTRDPAAGASCPL